MGGLEQLLERCDTKKEMSCMSEVGHLDANPSHKKVALLIAILALILAFAETPIFASVSALFRNGTR